MLKDSTYQIRPMRNELVLIDNNYCASHILNTAVWRLRCVAGNIYMCNDVQISKCNYSAKRLHVSDLNPLGTGVKRFHLNPG